MKTFTKNLTVSLAAAFLVIVSVYNAKSQTTLLTEDWESAAIGQTPPSGWGIDLVSGTNFTHFVQTGYNPSCTPYSGSRMVEFQSWNAPTGTSNRLKRTTPVSTTGYPYITVDFEWYTDSSYYTAPTEGVYVQWSTNGTTWTTAGTIFMRWGGPDMWVLETQPLPAGATNQPALYIALLFNSNYGRNCHLDPVHIKGYSTVPPSPTVTTTSATGIQQYSAVMNGTVNANGYSTTASFQYGLTTAYGYNCNAGTVTGNTTTNISAPTITYLNPNTVYHYRAVGNSPGGTSYGADSTFITTGYPPTVWTNNATNITATGATLHGTVNANGFSTTVSFQYGLTTSYGSTIDGGTVTGNTDTPVSAAISGLSPNTTYHYRATGTNTYGTTYGNDITFTTLASGLPPTVVTTHATNITATSATLHGNVNPNGSPTTVTFQYGLTTAYGNTYSYGTVNGNTMVPVSVTIYWFSPATTYHFRAVGTNAYGTTYGNDSVFTTMNAAPYVATEIATNISTSSATLNDTTNANGLTTTTSFDYGLTAAYGSNIGGSPGTVSGNTNQAISAVLTGLIPGTTYHYRGKGVNSMGTSYGNDTTFITLGSGSPPTVITTQATSITATGATLNGDINANGSPTAVTFQYGLTTAYGGTVSGGTVNGNTLTSVSAPVYGLSPATTYHYRAVGTNANGTTYGNDTTFTTQNAAPSVVTLPATNISSISATLNGTVNANGPTTTVSFDYGLTTSYGSNIAATPNTVSGDSVHAVSAALTGLISGTTYHFRVKGVNSIGTSYGADYTFTTLLSGNAPTVITLAATGVTSNYATMHGTVNPNGNQTMPGFEYGLTTSYGAYLYADPYPLNGNTAQAISQYLAGLQPGQTYHYRATATNSFGTSYGADTSFTTAPGEGCHAAMNYSNAGPLTIQFQDASIGGADEWYWYFGDGGSSNDQNPIHIFPSAGDYTVKFEIARSNNLCFDSIYQVIHVGDSTVSCHAQFSYTASTTNPRTILFTDLSTGGIDYRYWHFGDGSPWSGDQNPVHTYPSAGDYTVKLKVINSTLDCSDSISQVVHVSDSIVGCQAQFTYTADSLNPNRIQFIDQSTGNITDWLWNFDDDSSSVLQNPVHTFPGPGTYYVCLAIDGPNCLNTTCLEISVGNIPNCISYFTYTHSGLTVNLYGHLVNGLPATYNWSFGDGQTGAGQSIVHQYSASGVYYVTMTTIDTTDCIYSSGQTVMVGDSAQFLQIYGQIFAGSFPLDAGLVALFSVDTIPPYVPFINISNVDSNGVYYFPMVPQGDFYIYAIPFIPEGYLPTFYGNVLYWEDATIVHLGIPGNPYNINLIQATDMMEGNGSIHGQINMSGLKSTGLLGKIVILLMNSEGKKISYFKVDDQGNFVFPSLSYGTYYLKAEIAGVKSDVIMVVLSPENPQASIVMTFTGNRIVGINELRPPVNSFRIYPNPVSDKANIAMHLSESTDIIIKLLNLTGQQVFYMNKQMNAGTSVLSIPVSSLPAGMYTLCIISGNGKQFAFKLIR